MFEIGLFNFIKHCKRIIFKLLTYKVRLRRDCVVELIIFFRYYFLRNLDLSFVDKHYLAFKTRNVEKVSIFPF